MFHELLSILRPVFHDIDMTFFVYEWDNAQKKRKTIFELNKKGDILLDLLKNVSLPDYVEKNIKSTYLKEELEKS